MPARRDQIKMTAKEVRKFLSIENTLIIVSNGTDGFPHPVPMHFTIDDEENLWVITYRKSQKVKNFQRDGRASLLVESGLRYTELKGVVIYATAFVVDDVKEVARVMASVAEKREGSNLEHEHSLQEAVRATAAKRVALKFAPIRYVSWDHSKLGGIY